MNYLKKLPRCSLTRTTSNIALSIMLDLLAIKLTKLLEVLSLLKVPLIRYEVLSWLKWKLEKS